MEKQRFSTKAILNAKGPCCADHKRYLKLTIEKLHSTKRLARYNMTFFPEKSKPNIDDIEKYYTSTTNTLKKRLIPLPTTTQISAWIKKLLC